MQDEIRPRPGFVARLLSVAANILLLAAAGLLFAAFKSMLSAYAEAAGHELHHEVTLLLADGLLFAAVALLLVTIWVWAQKRLLGRAPWVRHEFFLPGGSAAWVVIDIGVFMALLSVMRPFFRAEVFYGLWHDPALPVQTIEAALLPHSGWLSLPGAVALALGAVVGSMLLAAALDRSRSVKPREPGQ